MGVMLMPLQLVSQGTAVLPPACTRLELFPSPLFAWRWPEAEAHRSALAEAIHRRRGDAYANGVSWQSTDHLPAWPEPAVQAITRWVAERVQEASLGWRNGIEPQAFAPWRVAGWADAVPAGGEPAPGRLADSGWNWSAYYCLDAAGVGGALLFEDRDNGLDFEGGSGHRSRRCAVSEGQLVAFPARLHHRIEPHLFGGEHLWIGFNLRNAALEAPKTRGAQPGRHGWHPPSLLGRIAGWLGRTPACAAEPAGVDIRV